MAHVKDYKNISNSVKNKTFSYLLKNRTRTYIFRCVSTRFKQMITPEMIQTDFKQTITPVMTYDAEPLETEQN